MSRISPRFNPGRRPLVLLFAWTLGLGLVLTVMAYAAKTPPVRAESASTAPADAGVRVNKERAPVPLAPQADVDLEINKEGPDDAYAGRVLTYTIRITNHTESQINNAIVTDTWVASDGGDAAIPAEFNGNYWTSPSGFVTAFTYTLPTEQEKNGLARWELDPLPSEFQGTIEFTMSAPVELQPLHGEWAWNTIGPSALGNSAEIFGPGVTVNEPDQVVTAILGPLFKLEKFVTTEPGVGARPGRLLTYSLRLDNLERLDSVPAMGIVIWEILPQELIYEGARADVAGSTVDFDPASRHITWTLNPSFALQAGETTTVTFTTRLSTTQQWKVKIKNEKDMCMAIANELAKPVECWERLEIETLSIFDKTYVAEPDHKKRWDGSYEPLPPNESYPNRYITYTIYVFNPLSQSVASNLRITDVMPPTWDFIDMVDDGPQPVSAITNTVVWQWLVDLQPNGVISFTFLAHIGPDTPVQGIFCGMDYYNDLAASANQFPIVYQYGRSFESHDGLAAVKVIEQVELSKLVSDNDEPATKIFVSQVAGELVTFTVTLENHGDHPVDHIRFTDTLPIHFRFDSMVVGPEPAYNVTRTVAWTIPTAIDARDLYTLAFRAMVEGEWQAPSPYYNGLDAYSTETTFCPRSMAGVKVLSPVVHQKETSPPLGSDDWVVQGEWFTYTVEYWSRSPSFSYTVDVFWDELPIVRYVNFTYQDYDGFEVNGSDFYTTTNDGLSFTLETNMQTSWRHTFVVDTPGYGSGTDWCNGLKIAEDDMNKFKNQEIYQEKDTFGLHAYTTEFAVWTGNVERMAPIHFKPHVDLFQTVYPKRVGINGTVEVTLTLYNNIRNYRGQSPQAVDDIVVTFTLPSDFAFIGEVAPSPAPTTQTAEMLIWTDIDLPAGEGQRIDLHFRLQAPPEEKGLLAVKGYAYASPDVPSICIPNSEAEYYVNKGVEIDKRPDPSSTGPFGVIEYNLKLINKTTAPVTGLIITDTLPAGFEFLAVVEGPEPDTTAPLVWRDLFVEASPVSGFGEKKLEIHFLARAPGLFGTEYRNQVVGVSDSTNVTYTQDYWSNVSVAVLPGVALYKSVWPEQADAGQTVVYTLTVDNRSGKDIAGVRITDTLPSGFSYQDMVSGSNPIVTTPDLVWTVDNLNNGEKAELIFSVLIGEELSTGDYCNQASAMAHEADNPSAPVSIPDTDLTACVAVKGLPNVQRTKTVSPSTVLAGNLVTYTITLYNDSGEPQTLRLTDTLPVSLTYAGVVDATPSPVLTSPVVWQNLSLGLSETLTLTFQARVDLYTRSDIYYNRLDVATAEFTLPPRTGLAPLEVQEIPRYDLQVAKSDGVVQVDEGDILIYTIIYTNATEADLTLNNVTITDTYSPQLYADPIGLGSGWQQVAPDKYTYSVGDLGPGESDSVTFTIELATSIPDTILTVSNTAEIGHATAELAFETDPSNDHSTDLDILRGSDLVVMGVVVSPTHPQVGQPITFSVTVRNQGDDATTNVAGAGWFLVDLYLKGTDFEPPGEPGAVYSPTVFDHFGSYCADYPDCTQQRPEYYAFVPGLDGDNDETILQFRVVVLQADDYELYVQVDTSFTGPGIGEPWGYEYGLILEAIESNNVYAHGAVQVGGSTSDIYLPVMVKDD